MRSTPCGRSHLTDFTYSFMLSQSDCILQVTIVTFVLVQCFFADGRLRSTPHRRSLLHSLFSRLYHFANVLS
ncbi:hypothetical protein AB7310_03630, partial [Cylindrospermopsis raciborskii UAM/DH-BiRr]|uniref:hypothetical protein n=1 Tax=Cylindrospermopsis raciborskii TaxID=77022 RepID=UPI00387A09A4